MKTYEGEKIRKYTIEVMVNGRWIEVASGESIGHKRIQKFNKVNTSMIRLNIVECVGKPDIKNFSVYSN